MGHCSNNLNFRHNDPYKCTLNPKLLNPKPWIFGLWAANTINHGPWRRKTWRCLEQRPGEANSRLGFTAPPLKVRSGRAHIFWVLMVLDVYRISEVSGLGFSPISRSRRSNRTWNPAPPPPRERCPTLIWRAQCLERRPCSNNGAMLVVGQSMFSN